MRFRERGRRYNDHNDHHCADNDDHNHHVDNFYVYDPSANDDHHDDHRADHNHDHDRRSGLPRRIDELQRRVLREFLRVPSAARRRPLLRQRHPGAGMQRRGSGCVQRGLRLHTGDMPRDLRCLGHNDDHDHVRAVPLPG